MEKEFVPYELAVKLKELGFDEPCFAYYNYYIKGVPLNMYGSDYNGTGQPAPTWNSAFTWFREKYNLHNGIYPYYDEYEFQIKDFRLPTTTPINGGLMKYEEAELACLTKLIEIVEGIES